MKSIVSIFSECKSWHWKMHMSPGKGEDFSQPSSLVFSVSLWKKHAHRWSPAEYTVLMSAGISNWENTMPSDGWWYTGIGMSRRLTLLNLNFIAVKQGRWYHQGGYRSWVSHKTIFHITRLWHCCWLHPESFPPIYGDREDYKSHNFSRRTSWDLFSAVLWLVIFCPIKFKNSEQLDNQLVCSSLGTTSSSILAFPSCL